MTQPTQELPPWLSASTFTTDVGGIEQTGTSVVNLPLTYFGPSIPLGTDGVWVFGGSASVASIFIPTTTAPASTATPSITATPSPSLSPTPLPSSATTPSPSLTPSLSSSSSVPSTASTLSSSSTASSSAGITPSPSSGSPSSTPTSPPASSSSGGAIPMGANRSSVVHRALPGIIIAGILLILFLLALLLYFRHYRPRRLAYQRHHANMSDFVLVDTEEGTRVAGEGVPRPTGGEEDSFLSRTDGADASTMVERERTARGGVRLVDASKEGDVGPGEGPVGVAVPMALTLADVSPAKSSSSPTTKHRIFGGSVSSLFFNPNRGPDVVAAHDAAADPRRSDSPEVMRESDSSRRPGSIPSYVRGPIIPPSQLLEMDNEWQREHEAALAAEAEQARLSGSGDEGPTVDPNDPHLDIDSPLRPPRILNPDLLPIPPPAAQQQDWRTSAHTQASGGTRTPYSMNDTPGTPLSDPELDERATFLTARRVNVNEAATASPTEDGSSQNGSGPSSWGLGLARLSRLSWFQRMNESVARSGSPPLPVATLRGRGSSPASSLRRTRSRSRPRTPQDTDRDRGTSPPPPFGPQQMRMLTDRELLAGRTLLGAAGPASTSATAPRVPRPALRVGELGQMGDRPLSEMSVQSRQSAVSSSGNTLYHDALSSLSSRSIPRLPHTPPADSTAQDVQEHPPLPTASEPIAAQADNTPRARAPVDILDTPVPMATLASPFSTSSSRTTGPSLPPGLEHATIAGAVGHWRESDSDMPSPARFSDGASAGGSSAGVMIDVLEEEPPRAREGWSSLRTMTGGIDSGRRTTLGQPILVDREDAISEEGSLHSMPTALSPLSPTAAGSHSRTSFLYNSSLNGSGSSRRSHSHHSQGLSGGSASAVSLAHSNSVSSGEQQRRRRREAGEIPATPPSGFGRASVSAMGAMSALGGGYVATPPRSPTRQNTFTNRNSFAGGTSMSGTTDYSEISGSTAVEPLPTVPPVHFPSGPWMT